MPLTKKAERTKAKLTASARKLISERGFDNVSVANGDLTTFPSRKSRKMPVWQKAHSTTILYARKMSFVNFPPES